MSAVAFHVASPATRADANDPRLPRPKIFTFLREEEGNRAAFVYLLSTSDRAYMTQIMSKVDPKSPPTTQNSYR